MALTKEQKNDLASLKKQQDDEIKLLKLTAKESGLSSKEISALVKQEQTANKTEYNEAKKTGTVLKDENKYVYSDLAVAKAAGLLPKAQEVAQETASRVQEGLAFLNANNLQQNAAKKGVGTGIMGGYILSEMSNAATPAEALQIAKTLGAKHPSEAVKIVEELKTSAPQEGEKLKQVKDNAGIPQEQGKVVYTTRKVGDGRTLSTVYLQTPDGNFQELGNTYQSVNTKEGIGIIGQLALGALGAFVLGPAIGAAFGGGTAGAIAGGALSGGITSELSGGDFLGGALKGGFSGFASSYIGPQVANSVASSLKDIGLSSSQIDTIARMAGSAAASASATLAQTGNLQATLNAIGTGAFGGGIASQTADALARSNLGLNDYQISTISNAVGKTTATAAQAYAMGQDPTMSIVMGLGGLGTDLIKGSPTQDQAEIVDKSTRVGSPQAALPPGYQNMVAADTTGSLGIASDADIAALKAMGITLPTIDAKFVPSKADDDGVVNVIATRPSYEKTDIVTSQPGQVFNQTKPQNVKIPIPKFELSKIPGQSNVSVSEGSVSPGPQGNATSNVSSSSTDTTGTTYGNVSVDSSSSFGNFPGNVSTSNVPGTISGPGASTDGSEGPGGLGGPGVTDGTGEGGAGPGGGGDGEGGGGTGEGAGGGGGSAINPNIGILTLLGLVPPDKTVAKSTPARSAPPGLITGSEDSDLSALFGGKPEELQDVWNQQSLRLRSALGI